MAKKTIHVELSAESIDEAISYLREYRSTLNDKAMKLSLRVAQRIAEVAQTGFFGAIVDDITIVSGGPKLADVTVVANPTSKGAVVVANGTDAVWVEFGAGVYHNGLGSPNPYGAELGFSIGGFGVNGTKQMWAFPSPEGKKLTRGTPANMPMYKAVQMVIPEIPKLAQEVFA